MRLVARVEGFAMSELIMKLSWPEEIILQWQIIPVDGADVVCVNLCRV
jgi:hypothetical protein